MSIYGHIRCNIITNFSGSYDVKNYNIVDGIGPAIFLSRNMLLPIIGTDKENDLFNFIIDKLNQTTITFLMKAGGDYFNNDNQPLIDSRQQMINAMKETREWNKAVSKLGLPSDFVEKCIDKDSMWVAEFFTKLYNYTK